MSYIELKIHGTHDFPLELYCLNQNHPKYEMTFHWHPNIEIVRVLSGSLAITLNNREYTANPGDVVFIGSETVHGAVPYDCEYECLVYNPEFLPSISFNGRSFSEEICNNTVQANEFYPYEDDEFHQCVNTLFEEMKTRDEASRYIVPGMLCRLYGIIIRGGMFSSASSSGTSASGAIVKLKKVLQFIRSSYDTQISLDDMAAQASMSTKYFCSFFKKMTHKSPVEYLIAYRIERACRKLIGTDKSVTDIAFECGFNDLSYFIKTFKEQKGVSPGVFRNM